MNSQNGDGLLIQDLTMCVLSCVSLVTKNQVTMDRALSSVE